MTDGQRLYAVFAALYLIECLVWLPHGWRVFRSWLGARSLRSAKPSLNIAVRGLGAVFTMPLPPLGGMLAPDPWLFIPDEDGIILGELHPAAGTRLSWSELQPRADQRQVFLTRIIRLNAVTPRRADALARWMLDVQKARAGHRRKLINAWWGKTFDLRCARAQVRTFRVVAASLRWTCCLAFFLCFAWLPFIYGWYGEEDWRLPAGAAMLFLTTFIIALLWRTLDKRLVPQDPGGRWLGFLHHLFMPQHAMRAVDHLSLELLAGIHPLAAGRCLLSLVEWQALAAETWRHWRFRSETDPLHPALSVVGPRLQDFLKKEGLTLEQLEAAPPREAGASAYCPRCHTTFSTTESLCRDCEGLPPVAWKA